MPTTSLDPSLIAAVYSDCLKDGNTDFVRRIIRHNRVQEFNDAKIKAHKAEIDAFLNTLLDENRDSPKNAVRISATGLDFDVCDKLILLGVCVDRVNQRAYEAASRVYLGVYPSIVVS
jgi:hypothetical protein